MTKIVKILDKNLHGSLQSMICQQVTLSGDAEWPKVADAVIEAVTTAVHFDNTQVQGAHIKLRDAENSFHAGESLALSLDKNGLAHVLVLSDGLNVNGTDLVQGLVKH